MLEVVIQGYSLQLSAYLLLVTSASLVLGVGWLAILVPPSLTIVLNTKILFGQAICDSPW